LFHGRRGDCLWLEIPTVVPNTNPKEETAATLWRNERRRFLEDGAEAHRLLKRINGEGKHLLALEVAEAILAEKSFDDAVPVQQQMARALAILGSSDEALAVLNGIAPGRADEAETLGLLARVWKDLANSAEDAAEAERCFRESFGCYAKGFEIAVKHNDAGGAAYCGINAAAVGVWLGESDAARDFAEKAAVYAESDGSYYSAATRAEASLILGKDAEAESLYRQASELGEAGKRWADIASTRKQCRALCLKLHSRRDRMDVCFTHGAVAIVSCQAWEEGSEMSDVKDRVEAWLRENGIRHAFVGAGEGLEKVFSEAAGELGIEIHVIETEEGGRAFADRIVAARGVLLASHLGVPVKALAIGDKPALTAAAQWKTYALAPHAIFPGKAEPDGVAAEDSPANPVPFPRTVAAQEKEPVLAVLHLRFPQAPGHAELETLSVILTAASNPPICTQGFAGDYLFAFPEPRHAAELALAFSAAIPHTAICLHAGPARMEVNPVLHLYAPEGETVSRAGIIAARLPGGSVSATETFTALSALDSLRGFRFEHSGGIEAGGKTVRLFRVLPVTRP
jgi:hypothetical protein